MAKKSNDTQGWGGDERGDICPSVKKYAQPKHRGVQKSGWSGNPNQTKSNKSVWFGFKNKYIISIRFMIFFKSQFVFYLRKIKQKETEENVGI